MNKPAPLACAQGHYPARWYINSKGARECIDCRRAQQVRKREREREQRNRIIKGWLARNVCPV